MNLTLHEITAGCHLSYCIWAPHTAHTYTDFRASPVSLGRFTLTLCVTEFLFQEQMTYILIFQWSFAKLCQNRSSIAS